MNGLQWARPVWGTRGRAPGTALLSPLCWRQRGAHPQRGLVQVLLLTHPVRPFPPGLWGRLDPGCHFSTPDRETGCCWSLCPERGHTLWPPYAMSGDKGSWAAGCHITGP